MSESHRIKGWTSDEKFQKKLFLWERGAAICMDLIFSLLLRTLTCSRRLMKHYKKEKQTK